MTQQNQVVKENTADQLMRLGGVLDIHNAATLSFFGHNMHNGGIAVSPNHDNQGLVFFTRPSMNLSYNNLLPHRKLHYLLSPLPLSNGRAIRAYLDPWGAKADPSVASSMVNNFNPFIPLLDNLLESLSGWPDTVIDTYVSDQGYMREQWGMVDGTDKIYSSFDLTATFRNIKGDPLIPMFRAWTSYASLVYQGLMAPYPEHLLNNEIDYQARIYRFVLDESRRYVNNCSCCGAGFPTTLPDASKFDYSRSDPVQEGTKQLNISFKCFGAMYDDIWVVEAFNRTVASEYIKMDDSLRSNAMVKVDVRERHIYNYWAYPRVDPQTMEFEWWVDKEIYKKGK